MTRIFSVLAFFALTAFSAIHDTVAIDYRLDFIPKQGETMDQFCSNWTAAYPRCVFDCDLLCFPFA
jgi:hypothetical protein